MLKPRFLNAALGFIGKKKKFPGRVYSHVFKNAAIVLPRKTQPKDHKMQLQSGLQLHLLNAAIRLVVELCFLQTQLKAYLELRFCKRSLKKCSYTVRFLQCGLQHMKNYSILKNQVFLLLHKWWISHLNFFFFFISLFLLEKWE